MRIEAPSTRTVQDSAIIPLINVVFLILIFLILAGQITRSDIYQVDLPDSISQSRPLDEVSTLVVNEQGQLALNHEKVELAQLSAMVKLGTERDQSNGPTLLVKADSNLLISELQPILIALKSGGLSRISIATLEGSS